MDGLEEVKVAVWCGLHTPLAIKLLGCGRIISFWKAELASPGIAVFPASCATWLPCIIKDRC